MKRARIILALLLTGCAGSGPNGSFTPADAETLVRATGAVVDLYERTEFGPYRPAYQPPMPGYRGY